MNEPISVMTDFGELVASPFAGGISVDINLPDGKSPAAMAAAAKATAGNSAPGTDYREHGIQRDRRAVQ